MLLPVGFAHACLSCSSEAYSTRNIAMCIHGLAVYRTACLGMAAFSQGRPPWVILGGHRHMRMMGCSCTGVQQGECSKQGL